MLMILHWASGITALALKYGVFGLSIIAFVESSFFPIPPDVLLIPMGVLRPEAAFLYAGICTVSSVLGGVFGYYLGYRFGRSAFRGLISRDTWSRLDELFARYGGWAVLIAAFTPIPFKVFTIASGVFRTDRRVFVLASVIGRGARFFMEALLIVVLGNQASQFLGQYFELITVCITIAAVLIALALARIRSLARGWKTLRTTVYRAYDRMVYAIQPFGEFTLYALFGAAMSGFSLIALLEIIEDMSSGEIEVMDAMLTGLIRGWESPFVTYAMGRITALGSAPMITGITTIAVVWLVIVRRIRESATVAICSLGAWIGNEVLKEVFQRPRPSPWMPMVEADGFSFPSGHAMISVAAYGIIAYFLWFSLKRGRLPMVFVATLLLLLIGISRVYLGLHYPSDVLGGYAAGGIWLGGCIAGYNATRRNWRFGL